METFLSDLRHASRVLRHSPGFTLTAIAVLALGIGASTAIFSVVNAVLLEPLPFPDSGRMVTLMNSTPNGNFSAASVPKYNVWRRQTQVLTDIAAFDTGGPGINLTGDHPEQVQGIHASHEFFPLFGVRIVEGRTFSEEEDRPGGGKVAVLSEGLWRRRYGSDPSMAGKTIEAHLRRGSAAGPLPAVPGGPEQHQSGPLFPELGPSQAWRVAERRQGRARSRRG
jgi:putative ABC transport system permease protein